jgi:BolA protein
MIKAKIEETLKREFNPESLTVIDESAAHRGHEGAKEGGGHYRVQITSNLFEGKALIERHKMVYQALDSFFQNKEIHALAIKANSSNK